MLGGLIETGCPVHILQGVQDPDVPWRHAVELVSRFARDDVVLTLIKDGDHRLSRPEDIERLLAAVAEVLGERDGPLLAHAVVDLRLRLFQCREFFTR